MPKRLISLLMILSLLCVELPAVFVYGVAWAESDPIARDYLTLKRGDQDSADSANIVYLQNRLIELGYLRDAADGTYGLNTETAVAAFQRSNGLEATGIADGTLQKLLYSGEAVVSAAESTDPESVAYRVQDKLAMWGFLAADPDGIIGSKTTEAVIAFKTYLKDFYWENYPTPAPAATPDPAHSSGYGDAAIAIDTPKRKDDGEINEEILNYIEGKYSFEVYHQTMSTGDSGGEVWRLQRRLHQLNYLPAADGQFGAATERALLYFQRKNGLEQTAVADEDTQRLLFSAAAVESEEYVCANKLVVDISEQMVYVYQWNGSNYGTCIREMICSTGENDTPTPLGTYQATGPTGTGEWYWFDEYECYAKWATRIVGGILFHSVTYSKGKSLNKTSLRKLGKKASHGCVRLKVEDAKWIY